MTKTILRQDKRLAEVANTIFGGLVVKAWAATWESNHTPRDRKEIDHDFKRAYSSKTPGIITDPEIVLEFTSGAKVYFTVSEWGQIIRVNDNANFVEYEAG